MCRHDEFICEELVLNEEGCPCSRDCCNGETGYGTPEHECPEEEFCEECYGTLCLDCGAICYCEL